MRGPRETDCGAIGSAEPVRWWRRLHQHRRSGLAMLELPGVVEDGMPGENGQRKLGTTHGPLRRSRTAKTSRISRHAVKSRCAREWDGWGRLSDDGLGQNNPDSSEGPWGGGLTTLHGGAPSSRLIRHRAGRLIGNEAREGRKQTNYRAVYVGSRLKLAGSLGRPRLICQPSSRTGENPPYGMIGGIEETSASFEARSAPRSYPTNWFTEGHDTPALKEAKALLEQLAN
jgi:hypothetical protein